MPTEVILPKVDMDMSHGTIAVWHVAEGDHVAKGAALFDIETDKAAMEVESPAAGRLHGITANPGDRVAVGTVVALIYAEGEADGASFLPPVSAPDPVIVAQTKKPEPSAVATAVSVGHRATPAARAAAREAGIDLADVAGTGPLGRIQRDDVTPRYQPGPQPIAAPVGWTVQPGPLHISHRKGTGTPLVLLHGFTADSQSWAPLEKALGPDQPLIRIDLPGHGRSPHRRLHSFSELSRMVVDAFDEATVAHDSAHLLGHSLGGALALSIADIRPRRVASLALIAPAGFGPELDAVALNGIIRASRVESLTPWLRRLTATPDGISDAYARVAMTARSDPALRAVQASMADCLFPDGVQAFDLRPAMTRLNLPACLIWGRQDHIIPWRHALAVECDIAISLLAGVGHIPQIESPDRVARILSRHFATAALSS